MAPPTAGTTPERQAFALPGIVGLLLVLLLAAGAVASLAAGAFVAGGFMVLAGLFVIQPNQAEVLVFLGRYRGTVRKDGWYWTNPFTAKRKLSLRVQNFNSPTLKVNDADGNPIEIAAVVVWRVLDTARAMFDVESYGQFIQVQAETAVRHIANEYPYDIGADPKAFTLRGSADEV